jgi:hypothetical protein
MISLPDLSNYAALERELFAREPGILSPIPEEFHPPSEVQEPGSPHGAFDEGLIAEEVIQAMVDQVVAAMEQTSALRAPVPIKPAAIELGGGERVEMVSHLLDFKDSDSDKDLP